jgi:hypothetical protein
MSQDIRRNIISENLIITPISHGQVHTFQIALPTNKKQVIPLEQRQAIEKSLLAHKTNLISLIIRRTKAYNDEDIGYELVYGADWLQIAQELGIEKVWAWVFDMTDEQADAAITDMEAITGSDGVKPPPPTPPDTLDRDIAALIDRKLQLATESIKNSITSILNGIKTNLDEELKGLNRRIDTLSSPNNSPDDLKTLLDKLDDIQKQLPSPGKSPKRRVPENPINLLEASDRDIESVLDQVAVQRPQIDAAIKAIHYWKASDLGLTWVNLKESATHRKHNKHKVDGFGKKTYETLKKIGEIP